LLKRKRRQEKDCVFLVANTEEWRSFVECWDCNISSKKAEQHGKVSWEVARSFYLLFEWLYILQTLYSINEQEKAKDKRLRSDKSCNLFSLLFGSMHAQDCQDLPCIPATMHIIMKRIRLLLKRKRSLLYKLQGNFCNLHWSWHMHAPSVFSASLSLFCLMAGSFISIFCQRERRILHRKPSLSTCRRKQIYHVKVIMFTLSHVYHVVSWKIFQLHASLLPFKVGRIL
jgi:hypothetical protein